MSYRRLLLVRWSTRDRLAVLVVGLTVAFLTGTVVLLTGASAQVIGIAAEFGTSGSVVFVESADAGAGGAVVSSAPVTTADGTQTRVVAVDRNLTVQTHTGEVTTRAVTTGAVTELEGAPGKLTLRGEAGSVTVDLRHRSVGILPDDWYVANGSTVDKLGDRGAFVVSPGANSSTDVPERGAPLRGALAYFVVGSRELFTLLQALSLGAGVLTAVTVYSVTRMRVRDRTRTIRIARSTGAPPRHIVGVFALRGGLIALVGAALGYALGVILPNAAVNLAVFAGLPTSLTATVSPRALGALLPAYTAVVCLGVVTGGLASVRAVRRPPARLSETPATATPESGGRRSRLRSVATPSLLGWRPLVPTAAAVTVFVTLSLVVASGAGAAAPVLTGGEEQVITQPGAVHPIASNVPEGYADALRSTGANASPEIIGFAVVDGDAFVTRGVDHDAYAAVTGTTLSAGQWPERRHEAVIGADLAARLGVDIGDSLTLGGSTEAALTQVDIVGIFDGEGARDDQLLVTLRTARHLSSTGTDTVQYIRTDAQITESPPESQAGVVDIEAPSRAVAGESVTVSVRLINAGEKRRIEFEGSLGDQHRTTAVTVGAFERATVQLTFEAPSPGTYTLRVGNTTTSLTTVQPDSLSLSGLPDTAPSGSNPVVTLRTATGDLVANATVTLDNRTVRTDADGRVRIPVPEEVGSYTVTARAGNRSVDGTIRSSETAEFAPVTSLSTTPAEPSVVVRPTVRLDLYNPWNRTLERTITLSAAGERRTESVTLQSGERSQIELGLPRQSPGTLQITARTEAGVLAERTVQVSGDDRLAAALASGGHEQESTAVGRAVATVFGNLQLVIATLVSLAGITVVGSVAAALASAVRARRRTIGVLRATGATPRAMTRRVLSDCLRVGAVATGIGIVLGVGIARLLASMGVLTLYGVRVHVDPSLSLLVGVAGSALALTLAGGWIASRGVLRVEPRTLLSPAEGGDRDE